MKRLLCCLLIPVLASCGDDEIETPVSERCVADGYAVYATGQIVTEDGVFPISVKLKEADGLIKNQELLIGMGQIERDVDSPNLLFKIRENVQANDLLDNFANASATKPVTLLLVDTSNPPENAVRRSDLSTFSCSIDAGSTCGQLAVDTADPGLISDDDDKVYNFTSGQFTIQSVNNSSSKVNFDFNVQLGRNILKTGDTSSGQLQGCISARYASAGSTGWTLR